MRFEEIIQQVLQAEFVRAKSKNPAYSIRAFARDLRLSAGALNEMMKGQRAISQRTVQKLSQSVTLSKESQERVFRCLSGTEVPSGNQDRLLLKLSSDQFEVISTWYHFAILSLVETRDFNPAPEAIAARLGISPMQAEQAFQRVARLGLIQKDSKQRWVRSARSIHTTDQVQNLSIQRFHLEDLELARNALLSRSVEERDFSALTLPMDPEMMNELKALIFKQQEQFSKRAKSGKKLKEVYRLATYFYPLTKDSKKKKERKR
jgi:predicted transcriptional regulator